MYLSPPDKISLARLPTPLEPLDRLSEQLGGPRIWVKRDDLTGITLSGNKVRKLEFIFAQAQTESAKVIMTCGGVQSNHCRATALVAAQLGMDCHLILRGVKPEVLDGNTMLAKLSGAQISYVSPKKFNLNREEIVDYWREHYAKQGKNLYWTTTGASDEVGLWGYYAAALELYNDFKRLNIEECHVCCATGSGGTHTGLALGFHHLGIDKAQNVPRVSAYAVCDDESYFVRKAQQDIHDWFQRYAADAQQSLPELKVNDSFIGEGYAIANKQVFETIELLAKTEGVVLDPVYTGKAFMGMVCDVQAGKFSEFKNLVFIHTGGIYGLFPYKRQFKALDETC